MNQLLRPASVLAARLASSRHGTILCFHGVEAATSIAPGSAHVSLRHLRETIDVACAAGEVVTLREMIDRQAAGKSTAGLFALTFDDAYISLAAAPVRAVLTRAGLPITIFVVSGASERGATFWWDRVEAAQPAVSSQVWAEFERAIGIPPSYHTPASLAHGPLRPVRQWVLQRHALLRRWLQRLPRTDAWRNMVSTDLAGARTSKTISAGVWASQRTRRYSATDSAITT